MNIPLRKILHTTLLLLLASLLLYGCAGQPPRHPPREGVEPERERPHRPGPEQEQKNREEPAPPEQEEAMGTTLKPQSGPAHTLYHDAEQAMQKEDYKRAEMLLERALRVEPKNGWYWHAMGLVQYAKGSYPQAIQFCLKSNTLAGRDADLKRNNRLLLKKAYTQTGDTSYK